MKNKKILSLFAGLIFVFALSGCGDSSEEVVVDEITGDIVEPEVATSLTLFDFSFDMPESWLVLEKEETEPGYFDMKLQVPDPYYNVIIPMSFSESSYPVIEGSELLVETDSGVSVYMNACAPAIACYKVVDGEAVYDVAFGMPESDQPVPEDVDGPWFPDTIITSDDTLEFVSGIEKM